MNFRVFAISFHFGFAESEITRRFTKTRKNESTKKCSLLHEPLEKGDSLRLRCLSRFCFKQRTARISPHRMMAAGAIRIKFVSELSKINCRRQFLISEIQASRAETVRKSLKRK